MHRTARYAVGIMTCALLLVVPCFVVPASAEPQSRRGRLDRLEDIRDRREDRRDRREDIRDAQHDGGVRDRIEDRIDRREDVRDRREDRRDRRH